KYIATRLVIVLCHFIFQAEDGIRDFHVTGVQTCALPIYLPCVAMVADMPSPRQRLVANAYVVAGGALAQFAQIGRRPVDAAERRSEERRVGKERRSRWDTKLTKKELCRQKTGKAISAEAG